MTVKSDGAPRPTHRQRQAQATRRQVAAAARRLFAERGYLPTTIAAISDEADIPVQTIYSAMGSKPRIFLEVVALAAAGLDIDGVHEDALRDADPRAGLRVAAGLQRRQYEQMFDVVITFAEAARAEPSIARALEEVLANRERAFRRHLEGVAGHLREGLTVDRALDLYIALVLPEVYRTLVLERGWSAAEYEQWLGDQLLTQLLAPQGAHDARRHTEQDHAHDPPA